MHNYHEIEQLLAARKPFTGNSLSARYDLSGGYRVYSYDTPILSLDPAGALRFFDNRYYSQTTSRHQSLIRGVCPDVTGGYDHRVVYDYREGK